MVPCVNTVRTNVTRNVFPFSQDCKSESLLPGEICNEHQSPPATSAEPLSLSSLAHLKVILVKAEDKDQGKMKVVTYTVSQAGLTVSHVEAVWSLLRGYHIQ